MDPQKIGKFIYELRIEKGLSQYKLADMIPISHQAVSKWEHGITIPDYSALLVLSEIFDVSTDELLFGRRFTKDDSKSDIQNSITLGAIDDINKKTRCIKKLKFIIMFSILIFIIIFLGYYFINSYNSIKVFTIEGESSNFKTVDGIFITTKDKVYFRLGDLSYDKDINVDNFELYYIESGEQKKVLSSDTTNILIRDYYGYNAFFDYNNLNKIIDNLYLRVNFNDTYEDIHLVLEKDFANNRFFSFNKKKVSSKDNIQDMPVSSTNNSILKELGKLDCDDSICNLEIVDGNHKITYLYIREASQLNVTDSSSKNIAEWNYFIDNGVLLYSLYGNNIELENVTINLNDVNVSNNKYIQKFYDDYIIRLLG